MKLSGKQLENLEKALIDAFPDKGSLERMLWYRLDKNLNQVTGDRDLATVVFNLIKAANAEGWIKDLVCEASQYNPRNLLLQAIATELLADNPTPSTSNNIKTQNEHYNSKEDAIAEYRKKVKEYAEDGEISYGESEILKDLQKKLNLKEEEVRTIRDKALEPFGRYRENLDKYRQIFTKWVDEQGYPLGEKAKADLKKLQEHYQLKDKDIALLFNEAEQQEAEKLRPHRTPSDDYGSKDQPSVNTNPPNNPPAQPVSQVFQMSYRNRYQVTNQWGGPSAPWQDGGTWVIGSRTNQHVVAINVQSNDGGQTLNGTMTYSSEGPIGFRATHFGSNNDYKVENQWGGDAAPWNDGGTWVIGSRTNQHVVAIDVKSHDGGQTLNGTITYSGEGPISFKGQRERI